MQGKEKQEEGRLQRYLMSSTVTNVNVVVINHKGQEEDEGGSFVVNSI